MKYFCDEVEGLNSDLERHKLEEAKIREVIEDETKSDFVRAVYQNFLNRLLDSKAQVVSKLGKSKHKRNKR